MECAWLVIFRKPLWAPLEHFHSTLKGKDPLPPGSGVDLEGPALSLRNEMALIQKCARAPAEVRHGAHGAPRAQGLTG